MKRIILLSLLLVFSLTGCSLFRGGSSNRKGINGGSPEERAMFADAINEAYNQLNRSGHFPRVKPYDGWRINLEVKPTLAVKNGRGVMRWDNPQKTRWTYATATTSTRVEYARPFRKDTAIHEAKHLLLFKYGYRTESRNHDPRAF